jgi:cytochrome b
MTTEHKIKRIWDLPTRLFHWSLLIAVVMSFITVKIGGNAMIWHTRLGYFILTLITFRVVWGFIGSHHSMFVNFIKHPKEIKEYLNNQQETSGHSPLGALSVLALLALFGFQAITGLFTSDDIAFDGPLVKYVSSTLVELLSTIHRLNEFALLAIVALHVSAILIYKHIKKIDLVKPMITGNKIWTEKIPVSRDDSYDRVKALVIFILISSIYYYFLR